MEAVTKEKLIHDIHEIELACNDVCLGYWDTSMILDFVIAQVNDALEYAATNCDARHTTEIIMRDECRKRYAKDHDFGDLDLSNAHGDRATVLVEQAAVIRSFKIEKGVSHDQI